MLVDTAPTSAVGVGVSKKIPVGSRRVATTEDDCWDEHTIGHTRARQDREMMASMV